MRRMRISLRLTLCFVVLIGIMLGISIFSIYTISTMSSNTTNTFNDRVVPLDTLDSVVEWISKSRGNIRNVYISMDYPDVFNDAVKSYDEAVTNALGAMQNYLDILGARTNALQEGHDLADSAQTALIEYYSITSQIKLYCETDQRELAAALLLSPETIAKGNAAVEKATDLFAYNMNQAEKSFKDNENQANSTMTIIIVIVVLAVVISVTLAILLVLSITKPVRGLQKILGEVADGNLDVDTNTNERDEIGELTRDTGKVIDIINRLIHNINDMSHLMSEGELDANIDDSVFNGSYKDVASGINKMVRQIIDEVLLFLNNMDRFACGDFTATLEQQKGKKIIMNQIFDTIKGNLVSVSDDINMLIDGAVNGDLSVRADAEKYKGSWNKIITGLNTLLMAFAKPMKEISDSLVEMSKGNMSAKMTSEYKGEYDKVKQAVNSTMETLNSYISEISETLGAMANQNFDLTVTRNYVGDFAAIKTALNQIIDVMNGVLRDINASAEQVAAGAKQISESSMNLSQGSAEQASAVEQLNATTTNIAEQTTKNAEAATTANKIANEARSYADVGNREMENMLKAMEDINKSSNSISKIIKVIDDIAFQTNLLALNATVEAAHAGSHGRGFAVVADQVRSLAGRSMEAAKDTAALIENSIEKVLHGTKIANQTSEALKGIVGEIKQVSDMIEDIAKSSTEQAESLNQINEGISQISQVTQTNTATSEEEAAAAQELSSQAEVFKNTVAKFNLK